MPESITAIAAGTARPPRPTGPSPLSEQTAAQAVDLAPAVIPTGDLQAEYEAWGAPPMKTPEDVLALLRRQVAHGQVEGPLFEFLVQTHASLSGLTTTAVRGLLGAWPPIVQDEKRTERKSGFVLD